MNDQERLERLFQDVTEKVRDRADGANRWQAIRITLALAALALGALGGTALFADWTSSQPGLKLALGLATLIGGLCGAAGAFLKVEDRYFANRAERIAWEALERKVGEAGSSLGRGLGPAETSSLIQALEAEFSELDDANLNARRGATRSAPVGDEMATGAVSSASSAGNCTADEQPAMKEQAAAARAEKLAGTKEAIS